uniref:Uncharacterized protein n=1 Tax=Timema poppense TaxID=170557 RepID=A0A7R9D2L6_TIMPO|nr:unnamed protein product [Timema poppensis]
MKVTGYRPHDVTQMYPDFDRKNSFSFMGSTLVVEPSVAGTAKKRQSGKQFKEKLTTPVRDLNHGLTITYKPVQTSLTFNLHAHRFGLTVNNVGILGQPFETFPIPFLSFKAQD